MQPGLHFELGPILDHLPADCQPVRVETLGSCGGLSGAALWRLAAPRGVLCLRKWPTAHPPPDRLAWIHRVLRTVAPRCSFSLPLPIETKPGGTFVEYSGHLWELTPWLAGSPAAASSVDGHQVGVAMKALAELHLALAASASREGGADRIGLGPAPGIIKRLALVRTVAARGLLAPSRTFAAGPSCLPEAIELNRILLESGQRALRQIAMDLTAASRVCVPLSVCLRDVWRPHVLFHEGKVSGIIDFGAMDVDCVAGDVARLLGSMAGSARDMWRTGLTAYESIRPLSEQERRLVSAYDRSGVLLAALNWQNWLLVEGRSLPAQ
jgi:Ser/Thr protein kinase RdoA (MazF antagonist)